MNHMMVVRLTPILLVLLASGCEEETKRPPPPVGLSGSGPGISAGGGAMPGDPPDDTTGTSGTSGSATGGSGTTGRSSRGGTYSDEGQGNTFFLTDGDEF